MDHTNNLGSYELRPLDAMNNIRLRIIQMILGHKPMIQNAMNNSGFWITWMTPGHKLKVLDDMNNSRSLNLKPLDAMNNSRLRMTWTILCYEPLTLNAMNSSGLCMKWMTPGHELRNRCYEQLNVVDDMNGYESHEFRPLDAMKNSRVWMIWIIFCHMPIALNTMNN